MQSNFILFFIFSRLCSRCSLPSKKKKEWRRKQINVKKDNLFKLCAVRVVWCLQARAILSWFTLSEIHFLDESIQIGRNPTLFCTPIETNASRTAQFCVSIHAFTDRVHTFESSIQSIYIDQNPLTISIHNKFNTVIKTENANCVYKNPINTQKTKETN